MLKKDKYKLDDERLAEVQRAMVADRKPEVRRRATAIHMLHLGYTPTQVAETMNIERKTLYRWLERWQQAGIAGLENKARCGRPRKANQTYSEALEETLAHEPADYGYTFAIWTVDRLRAHLAEETGINLSANRFGDLLKREGYVYRRPKHDLGYRQDPTARESAEEQLEVLKKRHSPVISSSSLWTKQP
jgi:transposase